MKKSVVINTQKRLFRYTPLQYGISLAAGIFQRVMEGLLQGIEGIIVYIDDMLVSGVTAEEHLKRLKEVLSRLEKTGLCLQKSKCHFMFSSVTFLGHKVDKDSLHLLPAFHICCLEADQCCSECPNSQKHSETEIVSGSAFIL